MAAKYITSRLASRQTANDQGDGYLNKERSKQEGM
jgi:hypothetical protein